MGSLDLEDLPEGYDELNLVDYTESAPFSSDGPDEIYVLLMETDEHPHKSEGDGQPYKFEVKMDKDAVEGIRNHYEVRMCNKPWLSIDDKYGRWREEYSEDFDKVERRAKAEIEDLFDEAYEQVIQ